MIAPTTRAHFKSGAFLKRSALVSTVNTFDRLLDSHVRTHVTPSFQRVTITLLVDGVEGRPAEWHAPFYPAHLEQTHAAAQAWARVWLARELSARGDGAPPEGGL
jgi:hypothetical protein